MTITFLQFCHVCDVHFNSTMWQFHHENRYLVLKFKAPITDDGEKWEKETRLFTHWPLMLPISLMFDAYTFTRMWQNDCEASYRVGLTRWVVISNSNPTESRLQRGGLIWLNLIHCKWLLHDTQHCTVGHCTNFAWMCPSQIMIQEFCFDRMNFR